MNKSLYIVSILVLLVTLGVIIMYLQYEKKEVLQNPEKVTNTIERAPYKNQDWSVYDKPSNDVLRAQLSPLAYDVTQEEGTEVPYSSEYTDSEERGIYVDVVSGEPLFSSRDKYHSDTGWPSFVRPIRENLVVYKNDTVLGFLRTEVRSPAADSHLGHVFDDGPKDRGGKRFCINGAALVFISEADMARMNYSEYLRDL